MTSRPRRWRGRIEPTDVWEQIELLCGWPQQRDYELIRPLVLFGASVDNRSKESGASSGRPLGRKAALWLVAESLTIEHAGKPLSRYAVEVEAATGELRSVKRPRHFEHSQGTSRPQQRLFGLDTLGEGGLLKAMKLDPYAPRAPREARHLQQALFPYAQAL